ncbi:uncharacterized protein [Aquarana catesbeiana]|uniref:uncharacterized protein n=1 Tax=Aquarana catesbeiana TaxID=8400 RepID=UPI003CC99AF1
MLHLLLLLLLGTAYAQEPEDCFENDVDELVDPSSQENDNDMPKDLEEVADMPKDLEEADDMPKDLEEADDMPKDLEEADDMPKDLEEADDMPKDLEEADDMPKDLEEADDLPKDLEEADDMSEDLEEADDMPEDLEEADLNDPELEMSHNTSLDCDSEATCHYKLYTCRKNFRSAQHVCRCQRGNLCSIRNSCVNNRLRAFARRYNQKLVWIGVWRPCFRRYRNIDGRRLGYTNFGCRQRKRIGKWCVALNISTGKWISVKCWKKLPYICRI